MLTLRFEPWPNVECVLDLPEPIGDFSAELCARPCAPHPDRYASVRDEGPASELAHARASDRVEPGEPTLLQVRDGPHELVLQLASRTGRVEVACTPNPVFAGAGRILVRPDPAALRAALERLRQATHVEGR